MSNHSTLLMRTSLYNVEH